MPTLVNSYQTSTGATGVESLFLTKPVGLAVNNLLLLEVICNSALPPVVPDDFVLVPGASVVSATLSIYIYQKIAGASEPDSYRVYAPDGVECSAGIMALAASTLTYPGVHQVNTNTSDVSGTSKVWNQVTNTDANTILLCFGGFQTSAGSTPNAGMTERWDVGNSPVRVYLMTQAVAATGATGTRTATSGTTTRYRTVTLSITETNTPPVYPPPEIDVTQLAVYAELEGDQAIHVTQFGVYAEIAARGLYLTEYPVYAEMAAVGIHVTQFGVLVELEYQEPPVIMPTYFPENAGTRKIHRLLPDEVGGYSFDPETSWWSTVVAEASTNLVVNPSFEPTNNSEYLRSGWAGGSGRVAFSAVGATAGKACYRLITQDADAYLEYENELLVTPGPYTFSFDLYVTQPGHTIFMEIRTTSAVIVRRTIFIVDSGWQRYDLSMVELGSGERVLRMGVVGEWPAGISLYTDAWQFEAKPYATTYLDGNMVGFSDSAPYQSYYWHGEPHRSVSTRRATTGSGGRVVSWSKEAKFNTISLVGLGMSPVEQRTQTLGDGRGVHTGMGERSRDFTIVGRIFAHNHRQLLNRRNDLIALLKPNNTLDGDQMILRFQEVDDSENLIGAPLDITCVYREGLQGNITGLYSENLPLQFRAVQPFPADTIESSAELTLYKELVDNTLVYRDEFGEYFNLGDGDTSGGVVARVGFLRDGSIVALGNFTQIAGVAIDYGARWNGTTWEAMGTAPSGPTDIDDGYRLGYPLTVSTVGGDLVEYDGSGTWTTLGGSGFIGAIRAIHRDTNGDVWVGGAFEFADDGTTEFNNVAKWNDEDGVWEQLGGGLIDPYGTFTEPLEVTAVLATNDGSVYFGGTFGDALASTDPFPAEVLAKGVARWDTTTNTWHKVGDGLFGVVSALIRGLDGFIYATGTFETDAAVNPVQMRGFARFNGYVWEEVFELVRQDGSFGADGMIQDNDGIFWFYNFAADVDTDLFVVPALGEVAFFGYRDGIFYPPYMADAGVQHMAIGPGNRAIHVVHQTIASDVQLVPAMNLIDYAGSADAPLAVHFHGPALFRQMINHSTKGGVYGRGSGFILSENEEMLLRTDTQRTMVYSNQRFNMQPQIAAGASNLKALRLRPGVNYISVFVTDIDPIDGQGWLTWKNRFWALEDGRG